MNKPHDGKVPSAPFSVQAPLPDVRAKLNEMIDEARGDDAYIPGYSLEFGGGFNLGREHALKEFMQWWIATWPAAARAENDPHQQPAL